MSELEQTAQKTVDASPLPLDLSYIVGEYVHYCTRPSASHWAGASGERVGRAWLVQAKFLFQRICELRGEEPQSHREYGLVCADLGDFQTALDKLWHVMETSWPRRFQHIEDNVFLELNRTIRRAKEARVPINVANIPEDFIDPWQLGIAVCLTWDVDDTCLDLHVNEPDGATCAYFNTFTPTGGWSTPDYSGCTGQQHF